MSLHFNHNSYNVEFMCEIWKAQLLKMEISLLAEVSWVTMWQDGTNLFWQPKLYEKKFNIFSDDHHE